MSELLVLVLSYENLTIAVLTDNGAKLTAIFKDRINRITAFRYIPRLSGNSQTHTIQVNNQNTPFKFFL